MESDPPPPGRTTSAGRRTACPCRAPAGVQRIVCPMAYADRICPLFLVRNMDIGRKMCANGLPPAFLPLRKQDRGESAEGERRRGVRPLCSHRRGQSPLRKSAGISPAPPLAPSPAPRRRSTPAESEIPFPIITPLEGVAHATRHACAAACLSGASTSSGQQRAAITSGLGIMANMCATAAAAATSSDISLETKESSENSAAAEENRCCTSTTPMV
jgi:hypothetical protein